MEGRLAASAGLGWRSTSRRHQILSFLAFHGSADTVDLAEQTGASRVTTHRDLTLLHRAGLVNRWRSDDDRTHTWIYEITAAGTEVVAQTLRGAGKDVPLRLGRRRPDTAHFLLFLPLTTIAAQHPDRCQLFQWLAMMDTSVWLRQRGLAGLRADGYGVWLEDGRTLRFLVHADPGSRGQAMGHRLRSEGLTDVLAGYRRTALAVPVGAVLVIADDADREHLLLDDLIEHPVQAHIAVSTKDILREKWPNDAVWRPVNRPAERVRLIDLDQSLPIGVTLGDRQ